MWGNLSFSLHLNYAANKGKNNSSGTIEIQSV